MLGSVRQGSGHVEHRLVWYEGIRMDFEEAVDEISDAQELIRIAYKKLMNVQKSCPNPVGYPLKDVIVTLGTAELTL